MCVCVCESKIEKEKYCVHVCVPLTRAEPDEVPAYVDHQVQRPQCDRVEHHMGGPEGLLEADLPLFSRRWD